MSDSFVALVVVVGAVWLTIGLALSIVMGRRGHSRFSWLVVGTLLGPLALVLAVSSGGSRQDLAPQPVSGAGVVAGSGPVDVLAGYDGSRESVAAVEAAARLLGPRLGRLTVATVVPFDCGPDEERRVRDDLAALAGGTGPVAGRASGLEVLHGRPAKALQEWAVAEGFDLVAVGSRGAGLSRRVLGSAAYDLARGGKIPVLVVGEA